MSTLKLLDELRQAQKSGEAKNYHLGRMLDDGMPFKGTAPFPMREEEYDEITEVTYDSGSKLFDVTIPEQNEELRQIIERCANGWYTIHTQTPPHFMNAPDGTLKVLVYCIWSVPHRQLNTQRAAAWGPLPS